MMGNIHMFASPVRQDLRPCAHPGTSAGALVQNSLCTFPEAPVENQIRQSLITTFSSCARCIIHQQPFIRCWKKNKLAAQSDTDTRGEDGPGHPPYNTDDIGRRDAGELTLSSQSRLTSATKVLSTRLCLHLSSTFLPRLQRSLCSSFSLSLPYSGNSFFSCPPKPLCVRLQRGGLDADIWLKSPRAVDTSYIAHLKTAMKYRKDICW